MFARFGLVLTVTHACNLRCTYCYAGEKFRRRMPESIGRRAIERATWSLSPGGRLELSFFGGEPLLEARLISSLIDFAQATASTSNASVSFSLTTNGTQSRPEAWEIMTRPDLELTISHDGLPEAHDRHRVGLDGAGCSSKVEETMRRLIEVEREFSVIAVVRPDTAHLLPEGLAYLRDLGVRRVEPSLDLWTRWTEADAARLEQAIARAARLWAASLPEFAVSWFDTRLARLARVPESEGVACGFGVGEIAVAPSGRLYPCERLIGEDREDNPMRLPGHVLEGEDFLPLEEPPGRANPSCDACALSSACSTTCRCSNYVRTGDPRRPDGLLCLLDRACFREVALAVSERGLVAARAG